MRKTGARARRRAVRVRHAGRRSPSPSPTAPPTTPPSPSTTHDDADDAAVDDADDDADDLAALRGADDSGAVASADLVADAAAVRVADGAAFRNADGGADAGADFAADPGADVAADPGADGAADPGAISRRRRRRRRRRRPRHHHPRGRADADSDARAGRPRRHARADARADADADRAARTAAVGLAAPDAGSRRRRRRRCRPSRPCRPQHSDYDTCACGTVVGREFDAEALRLLSPSSPRCAYHSLEDAYRITDGATWVPPVTCASALEMCFKCYSCCNAATARMVATRANATFNCSRAPGGFAAQCDWDGAYTCGCGRFARRAVRRAVRRRSRGRWATRAGSAGYAEDAARIACDKQHLRESFVPVATPSVRYEYGLYTAAHVKATRTAAVRRRGVAHIDR